MKMSNNATTGLGQQSASETLKAIGRAHAGRLLGTFSLVGLENALLLAYPVFAGYAVDAIIAGNAPRALLYALVVLAFWVVGALRRAVDTRTFTHIYTRLAVPVILNQREQLQSTSTVAARVVLARQFVDFFEQQLPLLATAVASIFGAAVMLLAIEPWVGAACLLSLLLCVVLLPQFAMRNQQLHERINDRLEHEIRLVENAQAPTLMRHYGLLARLRVLLSDREAGAYLVIGSVAALLFVLAIWQLVSTPDVSAGHVYAVMTYLWTFVGSLDDAPGLTDQLARLRDIGQRVDPGLDKPELKA
ncbi:ABC transporter six-transmembrane domain-containing protein [Massilia sp. erpn]|uniref:ABC transporter six-transmembrane domain-containing protein n=1 Tax=Massilia sp. erpn TaxID=2738142 RepID=UPI0021024068|nr:ABC transporter six-transmembrane domain-containing protein [Massilia sp. erpn]UTY59509.1 hypothetical protein HPQ68_21430 [Massilia sp. erpn]